MVLDRKSENMASFFQLGYYGAINTDDNTTNAFFVIKFLSDAYTLQSNTKIDGQVSSSVALVFKAQYILSVQENTNWYWKQKPLQQTNIVPTHTILNQHIEVIIIRYVQDITKKICGIGKAKKTIQTNQYWRTCLGVSYYVNRYSPSNHFLLPCYFEIEPIALLVFSGLTRVVPCELRTYMLHRTSILFRIVLARARTHLYQLGPLE